MRFAQAFAPVVDLVFPPRCPLCGQAISAQTGLCSACWGDLIIPGEPACRLCDRPFGEGVPDGAICAPCLAAPPRHDGIAAATLYTEASRKLVLAFKHGNRVALAPMMARLIAAQLDLRGEPWMLVPVPLHRWRLWARGYNQAAVLARELAPLVGAALAVDLLVRRKSTPSLGGLGAKARRRVLSGAIAVNGRQAARVAGHNIILVDDVLTSGATSETCVMALKRAGARKVRVACFARVLEEALPHA